MLLMTLVSLGAGCNKDDDSFVDDSSALKSAHPATATLPFEAHLLGTPTMIDF